MYSSNGSRAERVLDPKTIAIIGASKRNRIATILLKNILDFGFEGEIFPVNPNYDDIDGLKCYPTVEEIPLAVDLAVLVVPADAVPEAVESCVRAGVGAAVIMSAGFAEDERGSGKDRDRRLKAAIEGSDIVICGPNSEGYFNVGRGISLSFSGSVGYEFLDFASQWADPETEVLERISGGIAIVAQSGGLGFSVFGRGVEIGLGFSHVVSVGNEFDLDVLECTEYLLTQPDVRVVALYVEGFHRPERLREVAELARNAGKVIVMGKAGNSTSGGKAAMSHTGHLAGESVVNEAVFESLGILSVADQEEMLDVCAALSTCPVLGGNRVGVVSWSGGSAVWMADACETHGLTLPELDEELSSVLGSALPEFANIRNPIDITGAAKIRPGEILATISGATYLDALVLITPLHEPGSVDAEMEAIARAVRHSGKPVVVYSYTNPHPLNRVALRQIGVPVFESSTRAARALAALNAIGVHRTTALPKVNMYERSSRRRLVSERGTSEFLKSEGFPVVQQALVTSAEEAVLVASNLGNAVALKLQAPSIPHKKAVGGVILDLVGDDAVRHGYESLMALAGRWPDVEGVLVQEMVPSGLELIVGIDNTSGFGPMIVLGFGGSAVEEMRDSTLRCAPLDASSVRAMIGELRHGSILTEPLSGFPHYPIDKLVNFVVQLSEFAVDYANRVVELDINPVLVTQDDIKIVDSMMVEIVP